MLNILLLLIAVIFEICGDASIRIGLRSGKPPAFFLGAILVIAYGTMMSLPSWNFGRMMGVYIALFFIVSQLVAKFMLHEQIPLPTFVGGVLIVAGGAVILVWRAA